MNFYKGFLLLLLTVISSFVMAQIPSDLSGVKASQISNSQLQQYLSQAKANGITTAQLESELLRRGLPASELEELKIRIEQLESGSLPVSDSTAINSERPALNGTRQVSKTMNSMNAVLEDIISKRPKIFGSELFANANLSFEPDLRMATPKNYTIGPDDELLLNIYGANISQQTLKVSPEGTINVKYAGVVNVSGLTVDAVTSILKNRLTRYYPGLSSGQTKLQLTLGNIRSIRVILIGAIKRPRSEEAHV